LKRWLLTLTAIPLIAGQATAQAERNHGRASRAVALVHSIEKARDATWHWQDEMVFSRTRYAGSADHASNRYRTWVLHLWISREERAQWEAQHPPHLAAWLCIHRYEGSWTDPNAPYYGGLQMDWNFMSTYGAELLRIKGTADHWTPLEQMWVAERAYSSGRGFYPWPNSAHWCGLI
jgi:hypothetical protein